MAGLMDFLEPVLSRIYYKNKRQEERSARYQGLLDEYSGSNDASGMPLSSSTPNRGPQGLMGGGQQGGSGDRPRAKGSLSLLGLTLVPVAPGLGPWPPFCPPSLAPQPLKATGGRYQG